MKPPKIEQWPVERLQPYAKNARLHSDEQIKAIAASITEFGFVNPILIDADGEIVAGHGRALGAALLGLKTVPVIVLGHLTPEQVKAYRITDNRLAEQGGGWDLGLVKSELESLSGLGFDISLTGFSLADVGGGGGKVDPDAAPEPPANPVSRLGDLWVLGKHRVLCGDATSAKDTALVLRDSEPGLMVTDPPYGVAYNPNWRSEKAEHKNWQSAGTFLAKARSTGAVASDDRSDWTEAWQWFPGSVAYVWHGGLRAGVIGEGLERSGFSLRSQIIWAKQHFAISRGDYHWQHETCWYAVKGRANWSGGRKQSSLWSIPNNSAFGGAADDLITGHGTQKPVECMTRPMRNNSKRGDAVYDPFLGSGTSVIAAEMNERVCIGLEIDPAYCDVIVRRWQEFTGKEAVLAGGVGRPGAFAEVAAARAKEKRRPVARPARSRKAAA